MERDLQWIITRVDGKIASVSTDYKGAARVWAGIAALPPARVGSVDCRKITTDEVFSLSDSVTWDDLLLLGTPFQKSVWKALFDLTHGPEPARLLSYTQLAESLGKGPGVRAVAHAVGLNPVAVIIPCHLIIPKESLERLHGLEEENGLFKWETLYMVDQTVDYGEYALGAALKRRLIQIHMNR